jgi:hypothetical protein
VAPPLDGAQTAPLPEPAEAAGSILPAGGPAAKAE